MRFKISLSLFWPFISGCGSLAAPGTKFNMSNEESEFLNGPYGFGFFEATPKNILASGVQAWYSDWTIYAKANDPPFTEYGEINYFGQRFLQDVDYRCTVGMQGCNRRLHWTEIMRLYPNDPELARRVYFAAKRQNTVNLIVNIIERSARVAHESAAVLIGKTITTFTEQADPKAQVTCDVLKTILYTTIELSIDIAAQAVTFNCKVTDVVVKEVEKAVDNAVEGAVEGALEKATENALEKAAENAFSNAAKAVEKQVLEQAGEEVLESTSKTVLDGVEKEVKKSGKVYTKFMGEQWPFFLLKTVQGRIPKVGDSLTKNYQSDWLCGQFGGNFHAHNPEHIQELQSIYNDVITEYREILATNIKVANSGYFPEPGGPSQLSILMFTSIWANESTALSILEAPSIIEDQFKKQFTQYLVSTASRSSNCYMKCNTQHLAQDFCNDYRDNLGTYRICPRPNKVCQVQCWAQWSAPRDLEFFGIHQIDKEPFNLNLKEEMHNAYESYKLYGNRPGGGYWDVLPDGSPSLFRLPVCDSDAGYVDITDIEELGYESRSFPTSCGNWRSNETRGFMEFLGLDPRGDSYNRAEQATLYHNIIPREINRVIKWPLDFFLAYCELQMRFREHGDTVFEGAFVPESKHCDNVKAFTQDMPHLEANIEFCTGDYKAPLLAEAHSIWVDWKEIRNSKFRCSELMKVLVRHHTDFVDAFKVKEKWDASGL